MRVQSIVHLLLFAVLTVAQSLVTSTSGSCSGTTGETCLGSRWGDCCSARGFCGADANYCGAGCQAGFGICYANSDRISVDGSCGTNGTVCLGSIFGNCCSKTGFCGNTTTYCGTGCQSAFGACGEAASNASISRTAASAATTATLSSSTGVASSNATRSSTSSVATTSSSGTLASSTSQPQSVTESTGFKVGMAVVGIVLAAILAALIWFFFFRRSRQPQSRPAIDDTHEYTNEKKSMFAAQTELEGTKPLASASASEIGGSTIAELPATQPSRSALVDKRAAAGYDGAYRGN